MRLARANSPSLDNDLPSLQPEPFGEDFSPVQPTPQEVPAFNDLPGETPRPTPGSTPRDVPRTAPPAEEGDSRDFFSEDNSVPGINETDQSETGGSRGRMKSAR